MMRNSSQPCVLAVLVSGNGSNLQVFIDKIESGELNARIACVISNNPDAFALTRAKRHNIPVVVLENNGFRARREYDASLVDILQGYGAELVVLAVDCGTDTGPIILQAVVPVTQDDTEETLSARIQAEEHLTFPEAVRLFIEGRISVNGRLVRIQA